jgi:hypothetical protein
MPKTGSGGPVLDRSILEAALEGLEAKRRQLDEQIAEVQSRLNPPRRGRPRASAAGAEEASSASKAPKKRHMSAEGRRRIAEAARKRWAEFHKKQAARK